MNKINWSALSYSLDYDTPFNELNHSERLKNERAAPAYVFFNKTGNPFLGFLRFLKRRPVPKKTMNIPRVMEDLARIKRIKNVCATILLVFLLCGILGYIIHNLLLLIISMPVVLIVVHICNSLVKKNKNGYTEFDYKDYIVNEAVFPVVEDVLYEPHFGIPFNVVMDTDMYRDIGTCMTSDYLTGKYHGVYFVQAELTLFGDSNSNQCFAGRWIIIKYPKAFSGMVTVADKRYLYCVKKHKGLETVKLENQVFNSMFEVQSNNQQLAYYLLTPQVMEKLIYIKQNIGSNVVVCFKHGFMHIGINNKRPAFEPNWQNLDANRDIARFRNDFDLVSSIIEILDIDKSVYIQ